MKNVDLAVQKYNQILSLEAEVRIQEERLGHFVVGLTDEEMKVYIRRTSAPQNSAPIV